MHVPSTNPKGEPIGYYAVYHLKNGGYDFVYWTRERIEKHAQKFSQASKKVGQVLGKPIMTQWLRKLC